MAFRCGDGRGLTERTRLLLLLLSDLAGENFLRNDNLSVCLLGDNAVLSLRLYGDDVMLSNSDSAAVFSCTASPGVAVTTPLEYTFSDSPTADTSHDSPSSAGKDAFSVSSLFAFSSGLFSSTTTSSERFSKLDASGDSCAIPQLLFSAMTSSPGAGSRTDRRRVVTEGFNFPASSVFRGLPRFRFGCSLEAPAVDFLFSAFFCKRNEAT